MVDIGDLTERQLANAASIAAAAAPFGRTATVAALMCAGAESSWLRFANNGATTRPDVPVVWREIAATSTTFEHDAVAGEAFTTADSVGLFQQRPMFDYGSIAELMDPAESTRIFVRGSHGGSGRTRFFLQSPTNLSLAQRVQWTQGSEFPTGDNYAPFEHVAGQLAERFSSEEEIDMAQADVDQIKNEVTEIHRILSVILESVPNLRSTNDQVAHDAVVLQSISQRIAAIEAKLAA